MAATLSLAYEFEALPIVKALEVAGDYAAVMLVPQVHMRCDEMVERHPDLVVFKIPGQVFGSYNAGSALRMLLKALSENTLAVRLEQADRRIALKIIQDKCVLVVGWECDAHKSAIGYRIFDCGKVTKSARMTSPNPSWGDLEDVRAALRVMDVGRREGPGHRLRRLAFGQQDHGLGARIQRLRLRVPRHGGRAQPALRLVRDAQGPALALAVAHSICPNRRSVKWQIPSCWCGIPRFSTGNILAYKFVTTFMAVGARRAVAWT